jgi:hypothetical protein
LPIFGDFRQFSPMLPIFANFRQFLPIFGEKNGVFPEKQSYDPFSA